MIRNPVCYTAVDPNMRVLAAFVLLSVGLLAQDSGPVRRYDYAVVLSEPPVAAVVTRKEMRSARAASQRQRVEASQSAVRGEIERRGMRVLSTAGTLVNAIFVSASKEEAETLGGIPGVRFVQMQLPIKLHLNRALDLHRASQAWVNVGGRERAGAGIRIGIIDTGIDHTHPAFNDPSLTVPAGFPRGETAFTNNKIIVARSYVQLLPFADVDASDSRPDDTSPRDRVGHGTAAAMIAAGVTTTGPAASITGMAPKAFLGNYKIFGSPGVNDTTRSPVLIAALEDAFDDGMDVVTLSLGSPAVYPPLDQTCRDSNNFPTACDVRALAVHNASQSAMAVVVSAGNDGDFGLKFPVLNSIHTPGTAPDAITVGASTNSHEFFSSITAQGLTSIRARFGDGPKPNPTLSAPARDVASLGDDGLGCQALGNGTLNGVIAIVRRGTCSFFDKVRFAAASGALAVVISQTEGDSIFAPTGLSDTAIPAVLIGAAGGTSLRTFASANPSANVTLDARLTEVGAAADFVADFSSRGPSIGNVAQGQGDMKPEVTAVGQDIYTAAQPYDPAGELYDPSGYTTVNGTSFSVPLVAGAVAMVFQNTPEFDALDAKSAVVNTAASGLRDDSGSAYTLDVGAGKLDAGLAVQTKTTVDPAVLSFGIVLPGGGAVTRNITLRVFNRGAQAETYQVTVQNRTSSTLLPSPAVSSFTLQPRTGGNLIIRLQGTPPTGGVYEGYVQLQSANTTLRVPYLYIVCENVPDNIAPIAGDFSGAINESGIFIAAKVVDRFGTPVSNANAQFSVVSGGGRITAADPSTDNLGIVGALIQMGPQLGEQVFRVTVGGLKWDFFGFARQTPAIQTVSNGASFQSGAQAAGSYVSIFGQSLSDVSRAFTAACLPGPLCLPVSISGVSVSFDTPGRSFPGRLSFVSPGQINVQIPWEFQGLTNVQMKVSVGPENSESSALFTLPLAPASPAFFEFSDPGSGRTLAAALDSQFRLLTSANPAIRGQIIQIYMNGLGAVVNGPPSGEVAPSDRAVPTQNTPSVTIGGRAAEVLFSGLAPGNVGLYQVNVRVAGDTPTGLQPVSLTIAGATTRASNLQVQ